MKLADLQAKLKALTLSAPVAQPKPSRKRKAEPCPYDDVYYTAADLTEADKTAIARFHYAYFMSPAPTYMRPEDHITREILKKHTLLEWAPYLSAEKQTEIQCLYDV
jgi:hypothetical protein